MKQITIILFFLFSSFSFGEGVAQLLTVTSDAKPGQSATFDVQQEQDGTASWLIFTDFDGTVVKYTPQELFSGYKWLSKTENGPAGIDITLLSLDPNFDVKTGGDGTIRFLKSGAFGLTYINFGIRIQIDKDHVTIFSAPNGKDPESDKNSYSGQFAKLFLNKNTLFGQVIGVKKITPSL